MHKKIMLACMAIAAFAAFVIAPSASAATLTDNGVALPVGTSITGTSNETKFTAGTSTVTCDHAHMSGTLTANGGTVAGEILAANTLFGGTDINTDCTSTNLGPVHPTVNSNLCLDILKGVDTGTITGCGSNVTFTLDITNLNHLLCKYETKEVSATITTAPNDAAINVLEQPAKGESTNSPLCPAEGKLDMEFTLTTTGGGTLSFS